MVGSKRSIIYCCDYGSIAILPCMYDMIGFLMLGPGGFQISRAMVALFCNDILILIPT